MAVSVVLNKKQFRTLERFALGECPRCSRADFEVLNRTVPSVLQLESANGADIRSGYILTSLHPTAEAQVAVKAWLSRNLPTSKGILE